MKDEPGEFRVVEALREAVPTRRHAEMLFEMVLDRLGGEAWVETVNGATAKTLLRRETADTGWVFPWPLLELILVGIDDPRSPVKIQPINYDPGDVHRRPGPPTRIRGLGPGSVTVHDGPDHITVSYGESGRWYECSRSASRDALADLLPLLGAGGSTPVEIVAEYAAGLDPKRQGPGRVFLPQPVPGGARGAWHCGLFAIREALFKERVPRSARWVVADGWTGGAVAWGATRAAAMDAWRAEVARVRPFPEKPGPPPEPPPQIEGCMTISGPKSDVPWVEPAVETTPAIAVPLGVLPQEQPGFGEWTWLVGSRGAVAPAALRFEEGGFTLVGDRLLSVLDPRSIDHRLSLADLDAAPRPEHPPDFPFPRVETDCVLRTYRIIDPATGEPGDAEVVEQSWTKGYRPWSLDGDHLRWSAVRLLPDRS
jgi:hypothetical protein